MTESPSRALAHHHDFRLLWAAQTVSLCGTQVSALALPTLAILVLHAGAFEIGLLFALQWLPLIPLGPLAGVVVDRLPRRRLMILADVGRLAALASVPLAFALGIHSLLHLYLVAVTIGVLGVFFDISYISYLPSLVERELIVEGNARLALGEGGALVAGPALAGVLIGAVGAAAAILADAVSYAVSALCLSRIRKREERPAPSTGPRVTGVLRELREGTSALLGAPAVRTMVIVSAVQNLGSTIAEAVILLVAYRQMHLSPGVVGLTATIGSVMYLLTAHLSPRLTHALGTGRMLAVSSLVGGIAYLAVPLGVLGAPAVFLALWRILYGFHLPTYNVNVLSLRQRIIPLHLQGRVAATGRAVAVGTAGIGPLIGGLLGTTVGPLPTVIVGSAVFLLGSLPILTRPVITLDSEAPAPSPLPV